MVFRVDDFKLLYDEIKGCRSDITDLRKDLFREVGVVRDITVKQGNLLSALRVKSGFWGLIGGLLAGAGLLIMTFLKKNT